MTRPPLSKFMGAPVTAKEAQDRYEQEVCGKILTWLNRAAWKPWLFGEAKKLGQTHINFTVWNSVMLGFPAHLRSSTQQQHRVNLAAMFTAFPKQKVWEHYFDVRGELSAEKAERFALIVNWPYFLGGVAIHTQYDVKPRTGQGVFTFKQKGLPRVIVEPVRQFITHVASNWDPPNNLR